MVSWIDMIIVAILMYYLHDGWRAGVFRVIGSLFALALAVYLTYQLTPLATPVVSDKLGVPQTWTAVITQVIVFAGVYSVFAAIFGELMRRAESLIHQSWISGFFGALISGVNVLISLTFVLLLVSVFPVRGSIRKDIQQSILGNMLVTQAKYMGVNIEEEIRRATKEAIKFTTLPPESIDRLILPSIPDDIPRLPDVKGEQDMFQLVNDVRTQKNISKLTNDIQLTELARSYSVRMIEERYFSHVDPQGGNVADRAQKVGIRFRVIGENLAFGPDVATAHQGLLDSEGHRKNIESSQYRRIGIGIIDMGIYGKMVTQVYAD